jgi:serine/threonine protein phosphatase PrpC
MPASLVTGSDRRRKFRNRKIFVAMVVCLTAVVAMGGGWTYGGVSGAASMLSSVAATSLTISYLLHRQARRPGHQVRHSEGHLPAASLMGPASHPPEASSLASTPEAGQQRRPPLAPVEPPGGRDHRKNGRFPQPAHTAARANEHPWHLPVEPGPAAIAADTALIGDLELRAASIAGPGHRCERGRPRQDAYRLATDESGRYLIVAIADGMSDSSHSHLGANVATTAIVHHLRTILAQTTPESPATSPAEWFVAASGQMIAAAGQRNLEPDMVRAAALVTIVEIVPHAAQTRRVWLASIADVSAWQRQDRSWRQVAGDIKHGMDSSRLSRFLPFHPRDVSWSCTNLRPNDVLALTTDGIGDVLAGGQIATWFADQWATPPHISDFIDTVGFEAKGELDDRTAVVLWCPPPLSAGSGRRP